MICEDSFCQQTNQCKWDMPVSRAYCGNMYSPSLNDDSTGAVSDLRREVTELRAEIRSLNSKEPAFKPAVQQGYTPEYLGRRRDANRRKD